MNIYSIMAANCTALADDGQLSANTQDWYGKDVSVFIDQDANNPPGEGDAPSIQFHSWFKRAAEDDRRVVCGYELLITVADAADDETRAEDNAAEFAGTQRLAWIIERAMAVIRADKANWLSDPNGAVMSYEYETDTITLFPTMIAAVMVQFEVELTIGEDPFD